MTRRRRSRLGGVLSLPTARVLLVAATVKESRTEGRLAAKTGRLGSQVNSRCRQRPSSFYRLGPERSSNGCRPKGPDDCLLKGTHSTASLGTEAKGFETV